MSEVKFDRNLSIKTTGKREWQDLSSTHYHRYEATPYRALERLFNVYNLSRWDKMVDFGSGRGRVAFYTHHRFQIPVTGIEANDRTFTEALQNKDSYLQKAKHIKAPLKFEYGLAEHYEIKPDENRFYFFNPFSHLIFKKVIKNVLRSTREEARPVDIILYYPTPKYKQVVKSKGSFKLINKVKVPGSKDKKEKFLIYRLKED